MFVYIYVNNTHVVIRFIVNGFMPYATEGQGSSKTTCMPMPRTTVDHVIPQITVALPGMEAQNYLSVVHPLPTMKLSE